MDTRLALRIDDIGASSKKNEVYSHSLYGAGNWLFLKYLPPFKKWGPYREMFASEWESVLGLLKQYDAKLTVAITASWVESETQLIPFPERFPDEAAAIKRGVEAGLIEVANHGLTHCVLAGNAFKPKLFSGNRRYHREFWDWIPVEEQEAHLRKSQQILQGYFGTPILTFVPPGNVFSSDTFAAAKRQGLRYVSCNGLKRDQDDLVPINNDNVLAFHDRELVLFGLRWLEQRFKDNAGKKFCFVKDLGCQPVII